MFCQGILIDRRELLRIKFNSLMMESKYIRLEEERQIALIVNGALLTIPVYHSPPPSPPPAPRKRPTPVLLNELHKHRVNVLRRLSRQTHLALGFIKGRTLLQMEPTVVNLLKDTEWHQIGIMVAKYGHGQNDPSAIVLSSPAHEHYSKQRQLYQGKQYSASTQLPLLEQTTHPNYAKNHP